MWWTIIIKKIDGNVVIAAENSRKRHLERNKYNKGDFVQLTNWISKISINKPYFKRMKSKKGAKDQRTERYDIKWVITNANYQIYYVRIIEIVNEKEEIEA